VEKGFIPVGLAIPIYTQYLLTAIFAGNRQDRDHLAHSAYLNFLVHLLGWLILGAMAILLVGLILRKFRPDLLLYQYVSTWYLACSLSVLGYSIGSLSFASGVVLLGAPLLGFILLDSRVVWLCGGFAVLMTVVLSYASSLGLLPYAPLVVPPTDSAGKLFWTTIELSFAAPWLVVLTLLADHALSFWRKREGLILTLSRTDPLTGVHNRRSVMELLESEVARTLRHAPPLAVVILDMDFFKQVNDTWGHPTGDLVLKETARLLRETLRQSDIVGRYGGEEFILVLPDTTQAGSARLAERCRNRLAETPVTAMSGEVIHISASFGLACNEQSPGLSAEALIKAADQALYQAKHNGRNRVEVAAFAKP
jgi:diguanylate cyclase (GGDEF)-like protein